MAIEEKMVAEEKRREYFFWLREYMRRGGYGLFAEEYDESSGFYVMAPSEMLKNIQAGKPLPFSGQFLGACPPSYLFKAVMPIVYHRNADNLVANKILTPCLKVYSDDESVNAGKYYSADGGYEDDAGSCHSNFEPVVIDYSSGIDRAITELRALFDFHSGDWEKAALSLVAEEYGAQTINAYTPRAIGLWLWDFVEERWGSIARNYLKIGNPNSGYKRKYQERSAPRGAVAEAIRAFESQFDLAALGVEKVEGSDLRFFYSKTEKCIEDCRVYPFSKKGTQKRKSVPGTIKSK